MKPSSLVFACLAAMACAKPDSQTTDTPAPTGPYVVTISATDFAFAAPDTIPSGLTTFQLVNNSTNLHHATVMRIGEGKSFNDFVAAFKTMKPGSPPPSWITDEGGPNPPASGDTIEVTRELEAGTYALICLVDTPDRIPHFVKGMVKELVVVPSNAASAPAPASDVSIVMKDYTWDIAPALTAGEHMIKVENTALQSHEFFIAKLHEGKTPEDVAKWTASYQGPPPFTAMGGLASMRPGAISYVRTKLTPGNYMLMCFVPDAKDGKPHLEHGMVLPFTVS